MKLEDIFKVGRVFPKSIDEIGRKEKTDNVPEDKNISEEKIEFEEIVTEVGKYGLFQKRLLYYFLLPAFIPMSWVTFNQIFIMSVPDHWCYVPEVAEANLSVQQKLMLTRPMENRHGLEIPSQCQMYTLNYTLEWMESSNSNTSFKDYGSATNVSSQACQNGWVYDKTLYDSTASTHWDLVCEKNHFPHIVFTLAGVGGAVATSIYGIMSDRIGRKLTFFICIAVTLVSGLTSLVVSSFTAFAVLRLINGSLYPTIYQTPYIILVELVGKEKRTRILGIGCISWTIGICLLPLIAFLTRHWTMFGFITTCSCIPFFFYWRFLPESPRWLVSVKRYEEAAIILTRIARTNGRPVPIDLINKLIKIEETMKKEVETTYNMTVLFRYPTLRKHFMIVTLVWVSCMISYFSIKFNTTNLYGNEFLNFFLLGLVELPSYFVCWYLMETIGRRWTNVSLALLVALSHFLSIPFTAELAIYKTFGALVGKFCSSALFMVVYQQAAELFPTPVRALGMGASATIICIATVCAPSIIYLRTYEGHIPELIIGGMCLVASFAATFLPETLHAKLPQTIEDGEEFGEKQKYLSCFGAGVPTSNDDDPVLGQEKTRKGFPTV
ncbi:carcinine transporter-like [Limulus polyphemus]|uniref:Carcinine transporter-like n=1 Tax=Limulus polyphemus TaxID=6850 RepID=A0ABM1BTD5_LIMPO|nr:carcinine transporter-like [Limulus polyphemus]